MIKYIMLIIFITLSMSACTNRIIYKALSTEIEIGNLNVKLFQHKFSPKYDSLLAAHVSKTDKRLFYQRNSSIIYINDSGVESLVTVLGLPVSINKFKKKVLMIVLDDQTDLMRPVFRFYSVDGGTLTELDMNNYPIEYANINIYFGRSIIEKRVNEKNYDLLEIRLLQCLLSGNEYYQFAGRPISELQIVQIIEKFDSLKNKSE